MQNKVLIKRNIPTFKKIPIPRNPNKNLPFGSRPRRKKSAPYHEKPSPKQFQRDKNYRVTRFGKLPNDPRRRTVCRALFDFDDNSCLRLAYLTGLQRPATNAERSLRSRCCEGFPGLLLGHRRRGKPSCVAFNRLFVGRSSGYPEHRRGRKQRLGRPHLGRQPLVFGRYRRQQSGAKLHPGLPHSGTDRRRLFI